LFLPLAAQAQLHLVTISDGNPVNSLNLPASTVRIRVHPFTLVK
jgi:hypothetical protein